jgi:molecular chaperone GrpE (heat shock protein)
VHTHASASKHGEERRTNHRIRQLFDDLFQRTTELNRQVAELTDQLLSVRRDVDRLRTKRKTQRPARRDA